MSVQGAFAPVGAESADARAALDVAPRGGALELRHASKHSGPVQALDGCSLSVARGRMPGSSVAGRIDALGLLHSGPRLDRRAAWRLTREA